MKVAGGTTWMCSACGERYQVPAHDCLVGNKTSVSYPDRCHCSAPPDYRNRIEQWQCGRCGRIWSPTTYGWTEVRGPITEGSKG